MICIVSGCLGQEARVRFSFTLGDSVVREGQACPVHASLIRTNPESFSIGPFKVDKTHLE